MRVRWAIHHHVDCQELFPKRLLAETFATAQPYVVREYLTSEASQLLSHGRFNASFHVAVPFPRFGDTESQFASEHSRATIPSFNLQMLSTIFTVPVIPVSGMVYRLASPAFIVPFAGHRSRAEPGSTPGTGNDTFLALSRCARSSPDHRSVFLLIMLPHFPPTPPCGDPTISHLTRALGEEQKNSNDIHTLYNIRHTTLTPTLTEPNKQNPHHHAANSIAQNALPCPGPTLCNTITTPPPQSVPQAQSNSNPIRPIFTTLTQPVRWILR